MKKLMTTILGLFLVLSVNAQWYQTYGVTNVNELTYDQCMLALEKAENTETIGTIMTFSGAGTFIVGALIYTNAVKSTFNSTDLNFDDELNKGTFGTLLASGGAIVCGIGIPLWISGATQKSQIEVALKKFDTQGTAALGFGIRINF